jgi:hypothetical protein
MTSRRTLLAVPVAALALLAAGCGGGGGSSTEASDTTPTEEWASNFCTAITTWTDSLRSSVDEIQSGNISKEALQGAVDDAKRSTETLIDDLKGLGKPDTEAGQQAQETISNLADELQQDVDKIESAVNDSSSNLLSTISTITSTLTTMGSQLSSAFTELGQLDGKGELEDAFNQADSCKELTS